MSYVTYVLLSYHHIVHNVIVSVSDCISMLRLTQLHIQAKQQAYFPLPFTRPFPLLRLPYSLSPATFWALYMIFWAQSTMHWVWRQRGQASSQPVQGVWRWQHVRAQATAQQFKVATHASAERPFRLGLMGIGVVLFHIMGWICQIIADRGPKMECRLLILSNLRDLRG